MDGLEERLASTKRQIEQARGKVAQQEAALDSATAQAKQAAEALKALGFDSVEAAEARVAELRSKAEVLLTQIEKSLEEAER